jgi:hypothetical protein
MKSRYAGTSIGFTNCPATLLLESGVEVFMDIYVPDGGKSDFLDCMFGLMDQLRRDIRELTLSGLGPVHDAKIVLIHNTVLSAIPRASEAGAILFGDPARPRESIRPTSGFSADWGGPWQR